MAETSETPGMIPLNLRSSTVNEVLFGWEVWEGLTDSAYLRFSGKAASKLDLKHITSRVLEACRITRCQRILVDLRDLELPPEGLDVAALRQTLRRKQLRFAVKNADTYDLLHNTLDGEVSDNITDLAANLFAVSANQVGSKFDSMEKIELIISPIRISFSTWNSSTNSSNNGFISVSGYYRRGSDGKPDGMWIRWQVDEYCEYVRPHSLLIDLTVLDYESGDDFFVNPTDQLDGRILIVVPQNRLAAYLGVLEEDDIRIDLTAAFKELDNT